MAKDKAALNIKVFFIVEFPPSCLRSITINRKDPPWTGVRSCGTRVGSSESQGGGPSPHLAWRGGDVSILDELHHSTRPGSTPAWPRRSKAITKTCEPFE